jgi:hypothetical protein
MGLIGYQQMTLMPQGKLAIANYQAHSNPSIATNPNIVPVTWLNLDTGEIFTCIDGEKDLNKWVGSRGTSIGPVSIDTPVGIMPSDNDASVPTGYMLTSSTFSSSSGAGSTHKCTDWEISTDIGFTSVVKSSYADTDHKTSYPFSGLATLTQFWWRCRYTDSAENVSEWSTAKTFTTTEESGVVWGGKSPISHSAAKPDGLLNYQLKYSVCGVPDNPNKFLYGCSSTTYDNVSVVMGEISDFSVSYPQDISTNPAAAGAQTSICMGSATSGVIIYCGGPDAYAVTFTLDPSTGDITLSAETKIYTSPNGYTIYIGDCAFLFEKDGVFFYAFTSSEDSKKRMYTCVFKVDSGFITAGNPYSTGTWSGDQYHAISKPCWLYDNVILVVDLQESLLDAFSFDYTTCNLTGSVGNVAGDSGSSGVFGTGLVRVNEQYFIFAHGSDDSGETTFHLYSYSVTGGTLSMSKLATTAISGVSSTGYGCVQFSKLSSTSVCLCVTTGGDDYACVIELIPSGMAVSNTVRPSELESSVSWSVSAIGTREFVFTYGDPSSVSETHLAIISHPG